MKRTLIILALSIVLLVLPAVHGMAAESVRDFVTNGINNSKGSGEVPIGYIPTAEINKVLVKLGFAEVPFQNKLALLYEKKAIYRVSVVLANSSWVNEDGESMILEAPVVWFGSGSFLWIYRDGASYNLAIVKDGNNLSAISYDLYGRAKMKTLYTEPLANFTISEIPR